jgi:DNA-binding LacI/PurR family transcriptional regulator
MINAGSIATVPAGVLSSGEMPRRRRTTIQAIANALKISPGTVSRSLRDTPGVHPEMRERVRAMADSMGYIARSSAATDRAGNGKRTKIGVVVGDLIVLNQGSVDTSYIAYHFLSGLSQAANTLDAVMSVAFVNAGTLDAEADPQRELSFLSDVDGVVLIYPLPEPFVAKLVKLTKVLSL